MAQVALIIAVVLLIPAVWVARKATLRRLAWRNVTSRKTEAILVTAGTMLGTAIIVASFAVGDTIEDGVGSIVDTSLGPIDEAVTVEDPQKLGELEAAISGIESDNIDGVLSLVSLPTAVTTTGPEPLGEPDTWIAEVDFDAARSFGGDSAVSGFSEAGETPVGNEAVVISRIASQLDLRAGDEIEIHAYGESRVFVVRDIIDRYSAAGFNSVYLPFGTIEAFQAGAPNGAEPPRAEVLVSNTGGWQAGAELTELVVDEVEAATGSIEGVNIEERKANVLSDAAADGAEFTTLFNGIGAFAVIAGVLLIVNLFVMLAEERKVSLGVMRAVGFRRSEVTKAFAIEGAFYSITASVIGVGAGLGIGWLLVQVLKAIFFEQNDFLTIGYAPQMESMMLAAAIGLGITMITIWLTALRIAQFNVIAAIRDLPQPPTRRGRARSIALSIIGIAVGAGVAYLGVAQESQTALMAGVPIVVFSLVPLLRLAIGERWAGVVVGISAMVWGVFVFNLFPDVMQEADIEVFVVQGVVLVAGAVTLSASGAALWSKGVDLMSRAGAGLSARLGLVYPLARKGRTGLLLGMFSLVVFTITFLAVFAQILSDQTRGLVDDSRAGFDIVAESARFNPASESEVLGVEGVAVVAPLVASPAEFLVGEDDSTFWRVTGFDSSLLEMGTPVLGTRATSYSSDLEAFEAVLADESLIIVDDFFLDTSGGPGAERYTVGETVEMVVGDDITRELTIVGVLASDFVFAGSYAGIEFVQEHLDPIPGRYYVGVTDDSDAEVVASRLNAELLSHGVDAETFSASVEAEVAETLGIFRLFQGFLSLGLIIGIAGLTVVLVRAVRERRRAIGVLRAIGAQSGSVRRSFLVESGFVAVQGVVIGAALGLVTAYQVIVSSDTFGDADFQFSWPWLGLGIVLVIPTLAALLAAAVPSKRAAEIMPAVALRTE